MREGARERPYRLGRTAWAGDPVYDIAFWGTFHSARRHCPTFSTAYFGGKQPFADFELRYWLYFVRVALGEKPFLRHRLGYADPPGRPPASTRIQARAPAARHGALKRDQSPPPRSASFLAQQDLVRLLQEAIDQAVRRGCGRLKAEIGRAEIAPGEDAR